MDQPARPPRRQPNGYRLRVERITYLGDDAAAARAIEEFLRLSRLAERQRAKEREVDGPSRLP